MSSYDPAAAEEYIRSRDTLRELQRVGKETNADLERVKEADKNLKRK
jgi:hypothetical protein